MSLYFVFTIDGDWDEYFYTKLPVEKRKPNKKKLVSMICKEIVLASQVLNGKFIHFVHTSPLVRDFFVQPGFMYLWKELEQRGGDVGVHCHEEELYSAWFFDDETRMARTIAYLATSLRNNGLTVSAYRGGFMTFSSKTIPILEKNQIFIDFSCEPGRHLLHKDILISDWRGAPDHFYRLSYQDHRKEGDSNVFEIPLGIYIEKQSLLSIWKKARLLHSQKGIQVFSVLAHTYDFTSIRMRLKIKLALLILRRYGKFINMKELLEILRRKKKL